MAKDQWEIRLVQQSDNHFLAQVLNEVIIEMNVSDQGTAFADPKIDTIHDAYLVDKVNYRALCLSNNNIGCASISSFHDGYIDYCELKKIYFLNDARCKELVNKIIQKCLTQAKSYVYNDSCIEKMLNIIDAQKLNKNGDLPIHTILSRKYSSLLMSSLDG